MLTSRPLALPLHLRGPGEAAGALKNRPGGNPFCLLMAKSNQACAACYALQQRIEDGERCHACAFQRDAGC